MPHVRQVAPPTGCERSSTVNSLPFPPPSQGARERQLTVEFKPRQACCRLCGRAGLCAERTVFLAAGVLVLITFLLCLSIHQT